VLYKACKTEKQAYYITLNFIIFFFKKQGVFGDSHGEIPIKNCIILGRINHLFLVFFLDKEKTELYH